jgi:hypothetical protein
MAVSECGRAENKQNSIPEQQRGFLVAALASSLLSIFEPLTSGFQHLARALGAVRQRQGHNLVVPGELDLSTTSISFRDFGSRYTRQRTLSSTTNGPLMPPMVLYRIRGWTDIMRGSITSGMMAVVNASSIEGCWSGRFVGRRRRVMWRRRLAKMDVARWVDGAC